MQNGFFVLFGYLLFLSIFDKISFMRPFLSLVPILLALCIGKVNAQTQFAPAGSEWYHTQAYGVFHSFYNGDTVINGTACRKVKREANTTGYWRDMGLNVLDLQTLYVWNNNDTVFAFNAFFNKFTPLFVFNVNAGDTVRLPVFPPEPCGELAHEPPADSTFRIIIDSVAMVLYDTTLLKTVYSHPITYMIDSGFSYSYGVYTASGAYAEKIGGVTLGLVPYCISCIYLPDYPCQAQGQLRCYNDSSTAINLTGGICGTGSDGVATVKSNREISVFPSPSIDEINLLFSSSAASGSICLISMAGKEIDTYKWSTLHSSYTIPVGRLQGGLYLLKITFNDQPPVVKKVVVTR